VLWACFLPCLSSPHRALCHGMHVMCGAAQAYTKGVASLLKYFKGSNDKKENFDVTTPTLAGESLP